MQLQNEIIRQIKEKSEAFKHQIDANLAVERQKEMEIQKNQIAKQQRQESFRQVAHGCVNEVKEIMSRLRKEVIGENICKKINPIYPLSGESRDPGCIMYLEKTADFNYNGCLKAVFKPDCSDFNKIIFSIDLDFGVHKKKIDPEEFPLVNGAPPIEKNAIEWIRNNVAQAGLEYVRIRAQGFK
ncbi:MAG: hypothetical protein ABSA16_02570 [Thermoguttaceae bacterium]|jgi:hypothetical protein